MKSFLMSKSLVQRHNKFLKKEKFLHNMMLKKGNQKKKMSNYEKKMNN